MFSSAAYMHVSVQKWQLVICEMRLMMWYRLGYRPLIRLLGHLYP